MVASCICPVCLENPSLIHFKLSALLEEAIPREQRSVHTSQGQVTSKHGSLYKGTSHTVLIEGARPGNDSTLSPSSLHSLTSFSTLEPGTCVGRGANGPSITHHPPSDELAEVFPHPRMLQSAPPPIFGGGGYGIRKLPTKFHEYFMTLSVAGIQEVWF